MTILSTLHHRVRSCCICPVTGLYPLSLMSFSFIHVVAREAGCPSLLELNNILGMRIPYFFYPFIGQWACGVFPYRVLHLHNAAVNVDLLMYFQDLDLIILAIYPDWHCWICRVILCLIFWGTSTVFSNSQKQRIKCRMLVSGGREEGEWRIGFNGYKFQLCKTRKFTRAVLHQCLWTNIVLCTW